MRGAGASVERASSGAALAARLRMADERQAPKWVTRMRNAAPFRRDRVVALLGRDPRLANAIANREGRRTTNRRKGICARVTVVTSL